MQTNNISKVDEICNNSGFSKSLWMEVELPYFSALNANLHADVCIVGAGIAGLSCGYTLAKQGKSVVIVDQGAIAGGQTARTTAHLTYILEDRYYQLEKKFGEKGTLLAAESHFAAIDYIEKIILEEGIDCDFERVDGYLFLAPGDSADNLAKEFVAIEKTGREVYRVKRAPFSEPFDSGPSLHLPNQGQFHILKYIQGLIKGILKYGGKIFGNTHVKHFEENSASCLVKAQNGAAITCQSVVVATCSPVNNRFFMHTKQSSYRTYVMATSVPKGYVPRGLYWDTADPYHYVRVQKDASNAELEWLIIGGEDHKTGQDKNIDAKYKALEKWARTRFPMIKNIEYRWSGEVFVPMDTLGFIGKNPRNKNIYIATGDSGNGITHGTIAGMLIPDLILRKDNSWADLYDPSRKTLSVIPKFIKENLNVAWQYRDWLTSGEMKKIEALSKEEGVVIRKGLKKLAVYKDIDSNIHVNSAFCPHLGGCVRWNSGEKSWDCPCHGSRFNGCGRVITGPAINDLYPCEENM